MIPHHRFCLRQPLFSAKRNTSWRLCPWACLHQRQRGNVLQKNQTQFQWLGFFRPLQVRKGFCLGRHVGYCSKSQHQLTRCLRGACAELTRNLAMVLFNYDNYGENKKTLKKMQKETIVEGTTGPTPMTTCCDRCTLCLMSWFPYISKSPSETKPQLESLLWPAHTTHVLTHSAYAAHS